MIKMQQQILYYNITEEGKIKEEVRIPYDKAISELVSKLMLKAIIKVVKAEKAELDREERIAANMPIGKGVKAGSSPAMGDDKKD